MAQGSLPDYSSIINQFIASQEALLECHFKAEAMIEILLNSSFLIRPRALHDYFWALSDMIDQAKVLNEQLLKIAIVKIIPLLVESKDPPYNSTIH